MGKFDALIEHEPRLRAMTGFSQAMFAEFLPHFTAAMEEYLVNTTLDGYIRDGDRAITYKNSPLPTPSDRLLFILTYLKQNPLQEVQGQLFSMSQSNVSKWVRILCTIMNQALARQGLVPARTAAELRAYLETLPSSGDPEKPPLFAMMAPSDQ